MAILVVDFLNLMHRARANFIGGEHAATYNFFRQFRALVEQFEPTRVYVVAEGRPVKRFNVLSEYKANRVITPDDPRAADMIKFFKQVDEVRALIEKHFPVSFVRHPRHEADDTIANLVYRSSSSAEFVIVSSDSDFVQLVQTHKNVKLYNPVKKCFVEPPEAYDYVTWKALRGDPTDNVPGLKGIGDRTAEKLASAENEGRIDLLDHLVETEGALEDFNRNVELIKFARWDDEEAMDMTSSSPTRDWETVKLAFDSYEFKSITKDASWSKFVGTFDVLFDK